MSGVFIRGEWDTGNIHGGRIHGEIAHLQAKEKGLKMEPVLLTA